MDFRNKHGFKTCNVSFALEIQFFFFFQNRKQKQIHTDAEKSLNLFEIIKDKLPDYFFWYI